MQLLICDDDISTVDVIQNQLDCQELGITRVLRAYNGEVAKNIIAKDRPELILCDIGMPKCSGLEVLQYVYENKIETEFAFLTCHENFEYAQTALRYGATNYITKPFEMAELTAAVQRMIAAAKQKGVGSSPYQAQYDSLLSSVLRQISDGLYGTDRETIDSVLRRNGLGFSAAEPSRMVISCADMTDAIKDAWSRELLMYTVGRLHDETLVDYIGSAYTLLNNDGRFLWCRCFIPARIGGEAQIRERCEKLLKLCTEHTGLRPVILISEEFPLYEAASVECLMSARLRGIRAYAGRVLHIREVDQVQESDSALVDATQLLRYLKKHDGDGFREYISALIHRLTVSTDYTREAMDNLRRELINVFMFSLRDNNLSPGLLFEDPELSALNDLAARSADHMQRFAQRLFTVTNEQLQSLADADDLIARVEAYIRANFRENITREDVAAIAYITPNYLSKQFRNKMGMNLREYINQIRLEEAKRLLLSTNLSVSEIAGLSGYDNISYFSTVFRKHTGMSPIDWRGAGNGNGGTNEVS